LCFFCKDEETELSNQGSQGFENEAELFPIQVEICLRLSLFEGRKLFFTFLVFLVFASTFPVLNFSLNKQSFFVLVIFQVLVSRGFFHFFKYHENINRSNTIKYPVFLF
jgi:hypothetical protein